MTPLYFPLSFFQIHLLLLLLPFFSIAFAASVQFYSLALHAPILFYQGFAAYYSQGGYALPPEDQGKAFKHAVGDRVYVDRSVFVKALSGRLAKFSEGRYPVWQSARVIARRLYDSRGAKLVARYLVRLDKPFRGIKRKLWLYSSQMKKKPAKLDKPRELEEVDDDEASSSGSEK